MTTNHLGGSYLKSGMLKNGAEITTPVEGRNGGARTVEGKYGPNLEIPIRIEDQEFVLSIPADKGDGKALLATFGPVGEAWNGKRVRIYESAILERIRCTPVG